MSIEISSRVAATLMPFQMDVVSDIRKTPRRMLLLDTGVGKTIIAIVHACDIIDGGKDVLVVCPAALKHNWKNEFKKFAPTVEVIMLETAKKTLAMASRTMPTVYVASYSLMPAIKPWLVAHGLFGLMVLDEAHCVKHADSLRSKAVSKIKSTSLLLLTATPCQRHSELWHLLFLIDPQRFQFFYHYRLPNNPSSLEPPAISKDKFYFAEHFCDIDIIRVPGGRRQFIFQRNKNADELNALIAPFMTRIRKTDVLNLPPFTREEVVVSVATKSFAKHVNEEIKRADELRDEKGKQYGDAVICELLRATMRYKTASVIKYVDHMLTTTSEKFIVFYHHRHIGDAIAASLQEKSFIMIHGEVSMKQRPALFARFEHDDTCRVGLLSLGACGTGLTLTFVNNVLVAELIFDTTIHQQSEARCWRHGQTKSVVMQYLVSKNTTDDMVWRSMVNKVANTGIVLDGARTEMLFAHEKEEEEEASRKRQKVEDKEQDYDDIDAIDD